MSQDAGSSHVTNHLEPGDEIAVDGTEIELSRSSYVTIGMESGDEIGVEEAEIDLSNARSSHVTNRLEPGDEIAVDGTEIELSRSSHVTINMEPVEDRAIEMNNTRPADATSVTGSAAGTDLGARPSGILSIGTVHEPFRSVDKSSYTPEYVPIGPYHAGCSSPPIEQMKQRCVDYLEQRAGGTLANLVEELQLEARQYYRARVGRELLSRKILLHDGCYLLVCTVNYRASSMASSTSTGSTYEPTEHVAQIGADGVCSDTVARDTVFLMENQLPFFVLERIHAKVVGEQGARLLDDIEPYVQKLLHESLYVSPHAPRLQGSPSHLLHLVHSYFQPPSEVLELGWLNACWHQATDLVYSLFNRRRNVEEERPLLRTGRWRGATEYCKYGDVRFRRRCFPPGERWSVLDVRLQGGTLRIPRLRVDSMTWTILRNLMALEVHTPQRPVTAYCVFMSQLAAKVEDVETLQRQGILEQFLASDEEAANGFGVLCKGVVIDLDTVETNYLKPVWRELHERCGSYTHNTIGSFRHKHCAGPMFAVALVAAGFVFIFQLAQVLLTLIPMLQQHKH